MVLDTTFFLIAVPAVLFAGISKGGFASNASFASAVFLALILTPGQALGVMMPLLLFMDFTALKSFWGEWDRTVAVRMTLGGIVGVLTGAAVYRVAAPDLVRFLIGVVALGFVALQGAREAGWIRLDRPMPAAAGYAFGGLSGFTTFISHAGGPVASVYLITLGLSKTTLQATTVVAFLVLNILKLTLYGGLGIFTLETLKVSVWLAPLAPVGIWIGVWLHRRISERTFFRLTYGFLVATGGKLIWDAVT